MGPVFTASLFAIGAATWIFTKLNQRTGYGNTKNALIAAGIAGVMIFIMIYTLADMIM